MSTNTSINYESLTEDELYYLVGQAAVWFIIKGGERAALDDLLDDAEDEASVKDEA